MSNLKQRRIILKKQGYERIIVERTDNKGVPYRGEWALGSKPTGATEIIGGNEVRIFELLTATENQIRVYAKSKGLDFSIEHVQLSYADAATVNKRSDLAEEIRGKDKKQPAKKA